MRPALRQRLGAGLLVAGFLGSPGISRAGVCPAGLDSLPVAAVEFELLTGPSVLDHLPGPAPGDLGDGWIGTEDDGVASETSIYGAPNDLGRPETGLPGSPGIPGLPGSDWTTSDASASSDPHPGSLSLARSGEGAYSYLRVRLGDGLETLSYLGGGVSGVGKEQRTQLPLFVVQTTLAGTPIVPGVLLRGPVHIDLISVGPGDDRRFDTGDDTGETVARGCNGIAAGAGGVADWFPLRFSQGRATARPRITNRGEWDVRSAKDRQPEGRTVWARADLLFQVPSAGLYFPVQEMALAGYGFPLGEAEGLLNPRFHPDGNLPDIPGFPGSGTGLARYVSQVLAPAAAARGAVFVGVLRGSARTEVVGVPVHLEMTLVASGDLGTFDLCRLDVPACP